MLGASVKNISVLFGVWGDLKYLLQFLNEYGKLETADPGILEELLLGAAGEASGTGGLLKVSL